jgi:hypothetical protein
VTTTEPGNAPAPFTFPADELKALAVKVRGQTWADGLPPAWAAARIDGWSARKTAHYTCWLILNGDPHARPSDLREASRNPLEPVPVTEEQRAAGHQIAAEAKQIAADAQARWHEQNRKPQAAEPEGGERGAA